MKWIRRHRELIKTSLIALAALFGANCVEAQFSTAIQDGIISANEYGLHVDGQNQQQFGATTYFLSWDANNLYFAFSGSNYNEAAIIYLDFDPQVPVNGGGSNANGSIQGQYTYDRNHMMLPFRADFVLYIKNGYNEFRLDDGAGYWGPNVSYALTTGTNGGTNTIEAAIPWASITGGAMPAQFNWFAYKAYDYGPATNGIYDAIPVGNPNCTCNQDPSRVYATHYYNVLNTANGSATPPFLLKSFSYHQDNSTPGTGGYYMNGGSFYDFTINDNSLNNTDNDPFLHTYDNMEVSNRVLVEGSIRIDHYLYIGQGSALLPADNLFGNVLATITFAGSDGHIYNFGRIDPNPEAAAAGDWNNRRIDMVFAGTTRLQPTNLFKDRWRLSNAHVLSGASLLGPLSDSLEVELQFGAMLNEGTISLGDGTGGIADLGLRGDWSQHNDYYFGGTGEWKIHDILIGRFSSKLQPQPGGGIVKLEVQGDFENYDEFLGKSGADQIDVWMSGKRRQFFRGNTAETTLGQTILHNLVINNANALADNNNSADVHFFSYGGGTIDYYITGNLKLLEGDLVTRDRTTATIHNFTLRDSATVDASAAKSNIGTAGSCFVDGPMRYEVEQSNLVARQFPVGKTKLVSGLWIGDYRHLQLEIDHDVSTKTLYQAEMWLDDRSTFYTWPLPTPEVITWISRQRYWNLSKLGGANVDAAFVTLDYDVLQRNDGVNNAPALRIVKDDGAGNWVNITPFGPGGSANWTGNIRSHAFTSFSDFTLASIDEFQPLPAELLAFEAFPFQGAVKLQWTTGREVNLERFRLQKSLDRQNFEDFGFVMATGNTGQPMHYQALDAQATEQNGPIYYRLRLEDRDGNLAYSEIQEVNLSSANGWAATVYPNPAKGQAWVYLKGNCNLPLASFLLRDGLGRTLMEGNWPVENELELQLEAFAKGIYFIEIYLGAQKQVLKLIHE